MFATEIVKKYRQKIPFSDKSHIINIAQCREYFSLYILP